MGPLAALFVEAKLILRILLSSFLCCVLTGRACADTCLPEFTALDVIETVNAGSARTFTHPLKSKNVGGIFLTRVVLTGEFDGQRLSLTVRFPADGVSLPYNVYLLVVGTEQDMLRWQDLTRGCKAPGASIFPGQSVNLDAIKFQPDAGTANLHLILWGRL